MIECKPRQSYTKNKEHSSVILSDNFIQSLSMNYYYNIHESIWKNYPIYDMQIINDSLEEDFECTLLSQLVEDKTDLYKLKMVISTKY